MLASVITFAPIFLYDFYIAQPDYWGVTPAADQALAGALMMIEESIILTVAMVALFVRMLGESDRENEREERYGAESGDTRAALSPTGNGRMS